MFHAQAFWDVGLEGLELRDAREKLREGPSGVEAHLDDIIEGHLRRNGEAVFNFLGSVSKGGRVGEEDEGFATGLGSALEDFVAQRIVGGVVELEPKVATSDLGDLFDAGRRDGAQDKRNVLLLRRAGEHFAGFRPHEALETNGRKAKRRSVFATEEGGFLRGSFVIAKVNRLQLDCTDVVGVSVEVDLGHATASEVVVGEAGQSLLGFFGEEIDRGIAWIHGLGRFLGRGGGFGNPGRGRKFF